MARYFRVCYPGRNSGNDSPAAYYPAFLYSVGVHGANAVSDDRIIVNMLVYRFHPPQRDDVIVFRYPLNPSRDFIKRVVAFGGETVEVHDDNLIVNGVRIAEPFLPHEIMPNYGPFQLPQGSYFVMGDNRNNSDDSPLSGALFPREKHYRQGVFNLLGPRAGWDY